MAVIEVPGIKPIGAYFVRPVCKLYEVPKRPSSMIDEDEDEDGDEEDDDDEAVSATVFTVAGPAVPVIVNVFGKDPVMPLSENRFE